MKSINKSIKDRVLNYELPVSITDRVLNFELSGSITETARAVLGREIDRLRLEAARELDAIKLARIKELRARLDAIPSADIATPSNGAGEGQGKEESMESVLTVEYRAKLRRNLSKHFNKEELRTLCFDLGIEHENLPETKDVMARELVAYCERTGKIRELVAQCRKLHPKVIWEEVPQSTAALQATDTPNVSIEFSLYFGCVFEDKDFVGLRVIVTNEGPQVVNRFRVELVLTNIWWETDDEGGDFDTELVKLAGEDGALRSHFGADRFNHRNLTIIYQPGEGLLPGQKTEDIGAKIGWGYPMDSEELRFEQISWSEVAKKSRWSIEWKLYADNMPYRHGTVQVCDLPVRQY